MITTDTTITTRQEKQETRRKFPIWALVTAAVLLVLIAGGTALYLRMSHIPVDLDTATTLTSQGGLYTVSYSSDLGSVPVNQIQSWTLHVETPTGQHVENATIRVDGDMPQHGHGLPTRPQVTRYLGNGDYKVEGLKFHMPGWWVMDFEVTSGGQTDQVRFNLLLN